VDGVDNDDDDDNDDVLGNTLPEIVRLLSNTGAAELPDEGGMLPLHYAAAYGTTRQVLEVLLEVYPASLTKTENKGRNPLHLAMVNAHRQLSPSVINI
jgi:ankyrin repeat protein